MATITETLIAEHREFCAAFDLVERELSGLKNLAQLKRLAHSIESLLLSHAAAEEDLVLLALDHLPEHKRRADFFYKEHQEIDCRLTQVYVATGAAPARRLLRAALSASRRHFQYEERVIFPLIARLMEPATLERLGKLRLLRRQAAASSPAVAYA